MCAARFAPAMCHLSEVAAGSQNEFLASGRDTVRGGRGVVVTGMREKDRIA
jgi:hypothetical protein